jgi:hypothetical protein
MDDKDLRLETFGGTASRAQCLKITPFRAATSASTAHEPLMRLGRESRLLAFTRPGYGPAQRAVVWPTVGVVLRRHGHASRTPGFTQ